MLVLRFSAAGDILLTSPAIDALHQAWPETRILYVVKKGFEGLVKYDPAIAETIVMEPGESALGLARRLAAMQPGAILDLQGKTRTWLLRQWIRGVPHVTWTKRPWRDNVPVRMGWRPYAAQMPIADRYHAAVEKLVGRKLPAGKLRHFVGATESATAEAAMRAAGLDVGKPILGMSPGANWETKRWPLERYVEIAKRADGAGMQIVVTGSADEAVLGESIRSAVPRAANLSGKLPLGALGGVITRCAAFVANDSGPMHMARALGVPTLAFFGSTDPKQFLFDGHAVLFANGLDCAPCHFYGRTKCPRGHFRCMLDLTVDQAWSALAPLLTRGPLPLVRA